MAINQRKYEMPTQEPSVRARNFREVALGYPLEIAVEEAKRCLNRKADDSRTMNAVQEIRADKQPDRVTKNNGIPGQCGKRKALVKGPANRNRYT